MRSFVALVLVSWVAAACGGPASKGPKWPQMAEREVDGGESLAPRQPGISVEASEDKTEARTTPAAEAKPAATETKPDEAAKEGDSTTPTLSAPVVAPEEVIDVDEIVIEIED